MEALLRISSRENAAVKLYRRLALSKKARKQLGLFVLEGLRLTADVLQNGAHLTQLFWTEEGYARWNAECACTCPPETRCALISDAVGAELSQTEHAQGVYAICRMPEQPLLSELLRKGGTYAILHQLQDPGNAGMLLRTADAFGLDGVIYSACCEIYSPKVVRATMGSLFRVPVYCTAEIAPVLAACRALDIETCTAVVGGDAERVGQCAFSASTAVLIGNEGNGLPEEVVSACDRRVTIPMHGTIESLNAAMAAGIILWEVKRTKNGVQ